ncbi:hypothetical protein QAD02_006339 [Eretmocerus hayati]|uniref:Uncharacterized protein n=1 Tax=Eretmocerus hayati TaxID=131215 RepID=A0ACC2N2W7_9HYME|nr:hypothetical protein QAD02_006339 [Eretmocerus hayati]
MDNITNIPGPKEKTSVRKYLAFPSTSGTKKKTRKRRSQPNHPVVSSVEWRSHKQEQIDIQNQKDAETLLRKKIKVEREEASKIKKITDLRIKKENKVEKNMIKLEKEREKLRLQQEKMQILERERLRKPKPN